MHRPIVIVAAHPDDETIGATSLLLGGSVQAVVHLTGGAPRDPRLRPPDQPDRAAYERRRRDEALAALACAGLGASHLVSIGAVDQEAAFVVAPLARELAVLLRRIGPRLVVTHSFEGGHPDHDAAALATRAAVALLERGWGAAPSLVEMTAYHSLNGRLVTGSFLPGSPAGHRRVLSPGAQRTKRRMLDCYASQREVLAPFGVAFERCRRAPPISLASRPHAPPLYYEAAGWMTFEAFRARALEALGALGLNPASRPLADGAGAC
jgi:LmbE family N-acetylglucosaminyl deacetylase